MYMQFRNRSSAKVSMIVDQIVKNAHLLVWVTVCQRLKVL